MPGTILKIKGDLIDHGFESEVFDLNERDPKKKDWEELWQRLRG